MTFLLVKPPMKKILRNNPYMHSTGLSTEKLLLSTLFTDKMYFQFLYNHTNEMLRTVFASVNRAFCFGDRNITYDA